MTISYAVQKHRHGTGIPNFHRVDGLLYRGAKPNSAQLLDLRNKGITKIISFCTNYTPKHPNQVRIPNEAFEAENIGIKFHWLPFRSCENPPKEYVRKFFKIINTATKNNEKVFIHCKHGKDRTGLFAALYRLKNGQKSLTETLCELLKYGHDVDNNKNIIPFIIEFSKKLNKSNKQKIKTPSDSIISFFENALKHLRKIF